MVAYTAFILGFAALVRPSKAQSVIAHFMTQNSYSYEKSDWTNDMTSAKSIGIEGFALNVAVDTYEVGKIEDAYSAAEDLGFKLLYSFDMSYNWQQADMVDLVAKHATSASTFLWKDTVLVSTYSGDNQPDSFWADFKSALKAKNVDITLAPAFTSYRDPAKANDLLSNFPSIDGFFNWWSWPDDTNTLLTTDTDLAYQSAIKSRTGPYIMSVSPWQFKNIDGAGDWVELSDTLWNYRWLQAVNDVKPDIVEIVTWNDYGESHYISDIVSKVDLGTQAPLYVNGFEHSKWRDVAQYYISWFKTGAAPKLTTDEVVFWYRAHPKATTCSTGSLPRNADFPADAVFALAMLKDTATVTLTVGDKTVDFTAGPGLTLNSVPFPSADSQAPYVLVSRNGTKIVDGSGSKSIDSSGCSYYNFNPIVAAVGPV